MKIEQIYTGCLAQGAYYLEDKGEVAIIDPLREVEPYISRAERDQAKIKYIFETHFHADFVSGHLTLSQKTGAPIIYGPTAAPDFDALIAKDGQEFTLGDHKIIVLHTPGHTLESTTYLLRDPQGVDKAIFTGDTLFIGDVGRPDLAQADLNISQEELAGVLYDSLRDKIMTLADDVVVYPAHGAGSACGKNMSSHTSDTLANQKKYNYALRGDMTKEEFIKEVTDGLMSPPAYFPANVRLNKEGYAAIDELISAGSTALSPEQFEQSALQYGALILDVRSARDYAQSHIFNSIFIGLDGSFAPWVGELIKDVEQPILLVVDKPRVEEAVTRLARVGFDRVIGYLDGGISAWLKSRRDVDEVKSIPAGDLLSIIMEDTEDVQIIDVRKSAEYNTGHVENAKNYPLSQINNYLTELSEGTQYIHCAGGYRSMIAASILKSRGIHEVINVEGGFGAISQLDIPLSESSTCSAK